MWWVVAKIVIQIIAAAVISELLSPKPKFDKPKAPGLGDFDFPTADENRPLPRAFGPCAIRATNTLLAAGLRSDAEYDRVKTGLFSSTDRFKFYRHYVTLDLAICEGSQATGDIELTKIYYGERLVWSGSAFNEDDIHIARTWREGQQENGLDMQCTFYSGAVLPDPYLDKFTTNNPAYPHICRLVIKDGFIGTSEYVPPFTFHVNVKMLALRQAAAGIGGLSSGPYHTAYGDYGTVGPHKLANPAFVALDVMLDRVPAEMIDLDSFITAAALLYAENNGMRLLWDNVKPRDELIAECLRQANASLRDDPRTGLVSLKLVRPGQAPVFTISESNLVRIDSFTRGAVDTNANLLRLPFNDINAKFKQRVASVHDLAGQRQAGKVIPTTVEYPGVVTGALASELAMRDMRAAATPLAKMACSVALQPGQWFLLGDVVALDNIRVSDADVVSMHMRVTKMSVAPQSQELRIELVQDVFTAGNSAYAASLSEVQDDNAYLPPALPGEVGILAGPSVPYALVEDDTYQHALMFATPSATMADADRADGVEAAWWSNTPDVVARASGTGLRESDMRDFALRVALPGSHPADATAWVAAITDGDSQVLARHIGQAVPALFVNGDVADPLEQVEWLVVVVADNGDGTATITPSVRGAFGTTPATAPVSGGELVVLYGYQENAISPAWSSMQARAIPQGRGGYWAFDDASVASLDASHALTAFERTPAPRPYPVAALSANGTLGETSPAVLSTSLPTVVGPSIALAWSVRNKLQFHHSNAYTDDAVVLEPGAALLLTVTADGVELYSGAPGVLTGHSVDISAVAAGAEIVATVRTEYSASGLGRETVARWLKA